MKILLALLAAISLSACAQTSSPPASSRPAASAAASAATRTPNADAHPADAAEVQRALGKTGLEITGTLEAPAGYNGFLARYQGRELPIYALPDGQHIVVGSLFDLSGQDLTRPQMEKLASSSFTEAQWKQLESAHWLVEGNPKAKRIVYVFVDTRCPFCHHLWQASQPFLKKGNVQIRDILVGVIAPESLPEGAGILASKDPTAAWNRNEENFGKNPEPSHDVPADAVAKIRSNTQLMQQLGFMGTPSIIWKDDAGKIHTLQGMPRDKDGVAAIFGN